MLLSLGVFSEGKTFGDVGVTEVTQQAVGVVGDVLDGFRNSFVLDGEPVLVQKSGLEGGVSAVGRVLDALLHFGFAFLDLGQGLDVFTTFLGSFELSIEDDLSSGSAFFTEFQFGGDFGVSFGLDGLFEVNGRNVGVGNALFVTDFVVFASALVEVSEDLGGSVNWASGTSDGSNVLDGFGSLNLQSQVENVDGGSLDSGRSLFVELLDSGLSVGGRYESLLGVGFVLNFLGSHLAVGGGKSQSFNGGQFRVKVQVDVGRVNAGFNGWEDGSGGEVVAFEQVIDEFLQVDVSLSGFAFETEGHSQVFAAVVFVDLLEGFGFGNLCVGSLGDGFEVDDILDSSVRNGAVVDDLVVSALVDGFNFELQVTFWNVNGQATLDWEVKVSLLLVTSNVTLVVVGGDEADLSVLVDGVSDFEVGGNGGGLRDLVSLARGLDFWEFNLNFSLKSDVHGSVQSVDEWQTSGSWESNGDFIVAEELLVVVDLSLRQHLNVFVDGFREGFNGVVVEGKETLEGSESQSQVSFNLFLHWVFQVQDLGDLFNGENISLGGFFGLFLVVKSESVFEEFVDGLNAGDHGGSLPKRSTSLCLVPQTPQGLLVLLPRV